MRVAGCADAQTLGPFNHATMRNPDQAGCWQLVVQMQREAGKHLADKPSCPDVSCPAKIRKHSFVLAQRELRSRAPRLPHLKA